MPESVLWRERVAHAVAVRTESSAPHRSQNKVFDRESLFTTSATHVMLRHCCAFFGLKPPRCQHYSWPGCEVICAFFQAELLGNEDFWRSFGGFAGSDDVVFDGRQRRPCWRILRPPALQLTLRQRPDQPATQQRLRDFGCKAVGGAREGCGCEASPKRQHPVAAPRLAAASPVIEALHAKLADKTLTAKPSAITSKR